MLCSAATTHIAQFVELGVAFTLLVSVCLGVARWVGGTEQLQSALARFHLKLAQACLGKESGCKHQRSRAELAREGAGRRQGSAADRLV
jgi:hypothetical protein